MGGGENGRLGWAAVSYQVVRVGFLEERALEQTLEESKSVCAVGFIMSPQQDLFKC